MSDAGALDPGSFGRSTGGRGGHRGDGDDASEGGRGDGGDRGVSDLIGFVLVFSLVVAVVAIVSVAGLSTLESARDAQQTDNAERALEVLSDNMADIVDRGAPSRATEISLQDATMSVQEPIQVEVRDPGGPDGESVLETRVFHVRPLVYDDGDTELVYVMGAVFRDEQVGGTVIKPWSPILEEERTLVPVINTRTGTDAQQSIQSSTVLVRANSNQRVVAAQDQDASYQDLWINVTSPRRDLWLRMLDDHRGLSCSTAGPERVECKFDYRPEQFYVVENRIAVTLEK